jgi:cellulose synthase/poly-beta-1,6-N-acetylglucosamine synthase-like glycosyltransferase
MTTLRRPWRRNSGANICRGEFIAIFDVDHEARRDFLTKTPSYLADPEVAFVQTPQVFYDIDSFNRRTLAAECGTSNRITARPAAMRRNC